MLWFRKSGRFDSPPSRTPTTTIDFRLRACQVEREPGLGEGMVGTAVLDCA